MQLIKCIEFFSCSIGIVPRMRMIHSGCLGHPHGRPLRSDRARVGGLGGGQGGRRGGRRTRVCILHRRQRMSARRPRLEKNIINFYE